MGCFNREFCLCGVHVHSATKVIAVVFLILSGVSFLNDVVGYARLGSSASTVLVGIALNIFGVLVNVALLYGNVRQRSGFYWPFIIVNILAVVGCLFGSVLILIFGGALFGVMESLPEHLNQRQEKLGQRYNMNDEQDYQDMRRVAEAFGAGMSALMVAFAVLLMLLSVVYGYLVSVVIRGYRYLNESANPDLYNKLPPMQYA